MPLAYSYIRFSTPRQADGESLARQTRDTSAWCEAHGYQLVESYSDLGVSARAGKNSAEGALAKFLAAVRMGKVPPGSALVVEQLDRLSREALRRAVKLFLEILDLGIDIVTVGDSRVYRHDEFELTDIIIAVVQLSAAHAANEHRIRRVQDAMDRRRERAVAGEILSGRCPGWLRWDVAEKKYAAIPEKCALVLEIYTRLLAGASMAAICVELNRRQVPTLRGEEKRKKPSRWTKELLRYILRSPAVIGRHTPGASVGKGGETRENYYPIVIEPRMWEAVQTILDSRARGVRPRRSGTPNLLSGLCRCSKCGHNVALFRANGRIDSLHCMEPGCTRATLHHRSAELAVLALLRDQIRLTDFEDDRGRREEIRLRCGQIDREVAEIERQIEFTLDVSARDGVKPERAAERISKLERRIEELAGEKRNAKNELHRMDAMSIRAEVDQLREILRAERSGDQETRRRIANSLQQVVDYIVMNGETQQLVVHLRGSGLRHVLTPLSSRFRYVQDTPIKTALQVLVPDEGEVQYAETELLGGNLLVDRHPLGEFEGVYRRPYVEQLDDNRVLVHPRQISGGQHETLSLAAAARQAGVSNTRLAQLCRAGSVPGSYQGVDGRWLIPKISLQYVQRKRARYVRGKRAAGTGRKK